MSKIIDRSGSGASITAVENDSNLSSLSGINEAQTGTSHTIDVNDQNKTIEYSNASAIAVTLPAMTAVTGGNIDTDDFKVTLKNIGVGVVTVTRGSTDTFDDASTTQTIRQYEHLTIQTDSGLTKWNRLSTSLGVVTKTGTETLTNKTLTSPTINGGAVTSGSATATTSGTDVEFTSLPTWIKRISFSLSLVSTNGTNVLRVQLGDSGGYETTGYTGIVSDLTQIGPTIRTASSSGGCILQDTGSASQQLSGILTLNLLDSSTNTWVWSWVGADNATTYNFIGSGKKALSATLDRIKITANGVDTFDNGSVNILYE